MRSFDYTDPSQHPLVLDAGDPRLQTYGLCLDLTRQLLSHRIANTDGTFSRTIVDGGLHVA